MENVKRKIACSRGGGENGSALLIVLGMFAFMLVSAVAFSMYMRASRAPSSYLLRNTSMRQVVKAAVARAIDEVDTAIGNDPFPGVGHNHDYGSDGKNQSDKYKNDNWHGRVFVPSNEVAMAETVSTLTLEGLGYLPPCLVNEVRYWSRHTRTAKWHAFNYGLGRYAFTAVNVSDFFDLNAFVTPASGSPRQYLNRSSAPHGRISPTYLFRGGDKNDMDSRGNEAAKFLKDLASGSGVGGGSYPTLLEVPFLSLMDFNIVLSHLGNYGGLDAIPFIKLIRDNNSSVFLSKSNVDDVRHAVYMAGGWNGTNQVAASDLQTVDLSYPEHQPFYMMPNFPGPEVGSKLLISDVFNWDNVQFFGKKTGIPGKNTIGDVLPVLTQVLLADYLDSDNIPLSLCLPSTEIAPMVVGIDCDPKFKIEFLTSGNTIEEFYSDPDGKSKNIRHARYQANITVGPEVTVQVAFPFRNVQRRIINAGPKYKLQIVARLSFTPDTDNTLRMKPTPSVNIDFMKDSDASRTDVPVWPNDDEINSHSILLRAEKEINLADGLAKADEDKIGDPEKYLFNSIISIPTKTITRNLFEAWYKTSGVDYSLLPAGEPCYDDKGQQVATTAELTYPEDGDGVFRFMKFDENNQLTYLPLNESLTIRPTLSVWVRVVDPVDNSKVVDMVPATLKCDTWNNSGMDMSGVAGLFSGNELVASDRVNYGARENDPKTWSIPLIRYFGGDDTKFEFTLKNIADRVGGLSPKSIEANSFAPRAYMAGDPRYNWAPEDWYQGAPGAWLNNARTVWDNTMRDDFFMFVSNQGYLQSVYELMFIPRINHFTATGLPEWGYLTDNQHTYNGVPRTALDSTLHHGMMWRTYRQGECDLAGNRINYSEDNDKVFGWDGADDLSSLGISSSVQGIRVNPYTDITNIMFGAFANMPIDWMAAGTNFHMTGKGYMDPSGNSFDKDYIFDWSVDYEDVYRMSAYWMGAFRRLDEEDDAKNLYDVNDWENVFEDAWDWSRARKIRSVPNVKSSEVLDIIRDDLSLSDRKFIYGYLKECFANRSQLFLVFVRAETTAGGAVGAGARAVALVWRDPAPPMRNGQLVKADGSTESPNYNRDNAKRYLRPVTSNGPEESWRFNEREYPPHRTRILFYHQFD